MKKWSILLMVVSLGAMFISLRAWGAIAFDAVSKQGTTAFFKNSAPWTITWNHTCTGSNLVLTVEATYQWTGTKPSITGITYNTVALTLISSATQSVTSSEIWYLKGPATGSNAIVITFGSVATTIAGMAGAISLTGASQGTVVDVSTAGALGGASTISLSATTTVDNDWAVDVVYIFNTGSITSTNGTPRWGFVDSGDIANSTSSTRGPLTPPGSFSMGYTFGTGGSSDYVIAFIEPAVAAATGGSKSKIMDIYRREE